MIGAAAFGFIERCGSHRCSTDLLKDILTSSRPLGFEHLIFSGVPVGGQKLAPMVELMGWPQGWFERYCEKEHSRSDAVCIYSAKSRFPFNWDEIPECWTGTPESKLVHDEATEFGIRSGFAVPMHAFKHWQSVLSFASGQLRCNMSEHEKSLLVTMAIYAGMSIEAFIYGEREVDPLTERQKEVLLWAAEGKSAWDVSVILGISEATVRKHEKAAREALGVSTTIQAVVEAIRLRAIHP
ncbi:LuxR family transcriptional regulator [Mesorhizobium sp. M1A.T.Ca.IN.004.03.1.1]|uniref:LuxR family transcriptional regulator n=1 Tax=Mesorhizobium sp. M1A.T.Ca.IN.004.03.1.1 TaxID=2496795 RepID=UPI000FCB8EAC|nr:LuxR family transcriptional regulator [Mesorhizobium sp. M1A.T.Ca.IN.004.03.1.1]RUV40039.1 LuxR family transcriptional regulator [Mesorhizobium sp. M1A.T.Ca.IN.004.03.1.1]